MILLFLDTISEPHLINPLGLTDIKINLITTTFTDIKIKENYNSIVDTILKEKDYVYEHHYGPHDLAFALDLLGYTPKVVRTELLCGNTQNHVIRAKLSFGSDTTATVKFGNLMKNKRRDLCCVGVGGEVRLKDQPTTILSVNGKTIKVGGMSPLECALNLFAC